MINAPRRQLTIDTTTRIPKNRIGVKEEMINTTNPTMTESALKIMPRPVVVMVVITASLGNRF